jgi:hypothetical protein
MARKKENNFMIDPNVGSFTSGVSKLFPVPTFSFLPCKHYAFLSTINIDYNIDFFKLNLNIINI